MDERLEWLLEGDVSLQYLVSRDLLERPLKDLVELQQRIPLEGYGKALFDKQMDNGHWGLSFYQPKWISTHYTLLDLKNLGTPKTEATTRIIRRITLEEKGDDGGINPSHGGLKSDVCINGMFLNYACWFGVGEKDIESIIDYVITQQMADGGFNCQKNRSGAVHSSLHSTISVLEGIDTYKVEGYTYRLEELMKIAKASEEFILTHHLYLSDKTGEIIHQNFTKFSYPCRWYYDVLRGLEYFADAKVAYDARMNEALELLRSKGQKNHRWKVQNRHQGQRYFDYEKTGSVSRVNTYRALKVLKAYGEWCQ